MPWWAWVVLGVGLLGAEMLIITDFWLALVGAGALTVGLISAIWLDAPAWLQVLLFGGFSAAYVALFRRRLAQITGPEKMGEPERLLDGEVAVTQEEIAPGQTGRVELRGATWKGLNKSHDALPAGTRCRVEEADGLVVHIRSEEEHRARGLHRPEES